FRASGRVMKFDGFLKVYEESSDPETKPLEPDDEQDLTLPKLIQGEKLKLFDLTPRQHFTEPAPRYTEASLVKALEEKGIGRPSTYATILTTIDRKSTRLNSSQLGISYAVFCLKKKKNK